VACKNVVNNLNMVNVFHARLGAPH
jgi:hypothetical protein